MSIRWDLFFDIFINNLFFEEADGVNTGVFRVSAGIDASNSDGERVNDLTPGTRTLTWSTGLALTYEEYLSGNNAARDQRNLAVNANVEFRGLDEAKNALGKLSS